MSKLGKKFNSSLKIEGNPFYYLKTSKYIPSKGYLYVHDSNKLPSFPKNKLSSIVLDGLQMLTFQILYEIFQTIAGSL